MKKFLITTFALTVGLVTFAGNKVSVNLSYLKGQGEINYEVDWSKLTIRDLPVEEWLTFRQVEQPEYDAVKELEEQCKPKVKEVVEEANDKLEKSRVVITQKEGCKYTLCIRPLAIDKKGNNRIEFLVIETDSQKIVSTFVIEGKGGHFGSMANLWGDGFGDAGEQLGDVLRKAVK